MSESVREKLLSNIVLEDGPLESQCWIWQGSFHSQGYGQIRCSEINDLVHRVAYREFVGPIPEGLFCLHHCDNPPCINPEHLYVGTQQENVDDMWERGRAVIYDRTGSLHPRARLNEDDVRDILQALCQGESQRVIANERGLPVTVINDIARGKRWAHVEGPRPEKPNDLLPVLEA
jgi:hypothetical protein